MEQSCPGAPELRNIDITHNYHYRRHTRNREGGGDLEKLYINIAYDTEDLNNQDVKDGCMKDVWCYSGSARGEEYYTWRKRSIQVAKKISIEGF